MKDQLMKQVQFAEYGNSDVLQLIEKQIPTPQAGELLIKVEAAGVNYSDILRRRNTYFMPTPLPYILGAEAVGVIEQAGEGLDETPFQPGSRVLAILPSGGAYSEYVIANPMYCVPLPPHVDAKAASAIFVQGSTAHLIINEVLGDIEGKTILIHAAAGGVGSILVQLAVLAGARVIATASSEAKLQYAKELGAEIGINYTESDWPAKLLAANGGEEVDYVLEMVGGEIYAQSFACLKEGGTMVVYGAASGKKGYIHSEHFVDKCQQLRSFNLAYFIQNKSQLWQQSLGAMIGLIAESKIKIQVSNSYPLSHASLAHADIEARKTIGKVVLIP